MTGSTHTHTHTLTENTCDPFSSVTSASWSPKPILYTEIYFYKLWLVSNVYQIHTQKCAHTHAHTNVHVHGHTNPHTLVVSIALILQLKCNDFLLLWAMVSVITRVDPNEDNFVSAGIINTRTTLIGCLMRLEPNKDTKISGQTPCTHYSCWKLVHQGFSLGGGDTPLGFKKLIDLCWGY